MCYFLFFFPSTTNSQQSLFTLQRKHAFSKRVGNRAASGQVDYVYRLVIVMVLVTVRVVVQQVVNECERAGGLVAAELLKMLQQRRSRTYESVHFEHSYFEITGNAQRRVVECLAAVRFAEADVLVHPDRLSLTSPDCYHLGVGGHK